MEFNIERAGKLFDLADADKSGALSRKEVKDVITKLKGDVEPSEVELKNAFDAMDRDGDGKIDREEFLTAMTQWLQQAAEVSAPTSRVKRSIGSPPSAASRKKAAAAVSMASFFNQFAGADATELRRRIETQQAPGMELNNDLAAVLRDFPVNTVAEKLSYFDEATEQMKVSGDLFFALHSTQWDEIEVALQIVGRFLEVGDVFPSPSEKMALWPLFDQIYTFFTQVDTSGRVSGEPLSIIRRVAQLLRLPIPASKQVQFYTLCLKALANYIPGPEFPCPRDSHWHPSENLTRNIMRHEQLIPSLFNILKEHGRNLSSLESVRLLESFSQCLHALCKDNFEMTDIAISDRMREGVRCLTEAVVAQKQGPRDVAGVQYGLDSFAPLLQNLLGALSVMCGYTHDEGRSSFELFKLDADEAASIVSVTGLCIEFLTNCQALHIHQIAMIHVSIIWQYLLPVLQSNNALFTSVINENIRLLGLHWDMSPAGVQVVVNLLLSVAELMEAGATSSAVYIAIWDLAQSNFKNNFRHQFQVGLQGGQTTWPICEACYHVLLLLLARGQQDHLIVPADDKDPASFFGAVVFQQSRLLLATTEDPYVVIDFLCKCLEKDDLIDTVVRVGVIDAFFEYFARFKTNHAISDIFNKHLAPTYEIQALTEVINALKLFVDRHVVISGGSGGVSDYHKAFTLDHFDAVELLHVVICRELRRNRLRMSFELEVLIVNLEELIQKIVEVHVAAGSLVHDVMEEELKVMQVKWPKEREEAYKMGVSRTLPKAVWMDIRTTPLWESTGIKGFDKSVEPAIFKDISVSVVDYDSLKNHLGRFYKRPIHLYGSQQEASLIDNQEEYAKHLHRFVKVPDSTEKIFVEFYVHVDESGAVRHSQNFFDAGTAVGISTKQADLQKLLAHAGNDKSKLQSNKTVERFYEYFKSNGIEVADEATFIKLMTSPSMGFEHNTAKSAFDAFDANRDGGLSLKEIAIGFSQLSSDDAPTRLKVLFNIYDVDGNGKLDENELADMIVKATGKSIPDAAKMAKDGIAKQDKDGDAMLDLDEFTLLARSGVIDLGIDFPQKRDRDRDGDKKDSYGHHDKKSHNKGQQNEKEDTRGSQLCSFLFTKAGCSKGDLCTFKHGDISRASRGDKERVQKTLERMKRKDINYDALK
mmetsp:Transcript_20170/g.34002  ORF Transcript_20170/g.34002 Transcript_20170/m.34002 type:complete len:1156 (-) Transcript_20170:131-3598(-)